MVEINIKDPKLAGVIVFVSMLLGIGGTMTLTQEQFDNAYVCSDTDELQIFYGGISDSKITGYPSDETTKGAKRCYKVYREWGEWIPLKEYCEKKGIDPKKFLESKIGEENLDAIFICNEGEKCKYATLVKMEEWVGDEKYEAEVRKEVKSIPLLCMKDNVYCEYEVKDFADKDAISTRVALTDADCINESSWNQRPFPEGTFEKCAPKLVVVK